MQLIRFFALVFPPQLWLRPYHILSTGPRSGLLEFLPNTQSLHALKRQVAVRVECKNDHQREEEKARSFAIQIDSRKTNLETRF